MSELGVSDDAYRAAAAAAIEWAASRGLRIATAESLTGGLLADALVTVPGASRSFSGGVVAYDTALKHSMLGVDADRLRETGPVDEEVARQMAAGVRAACALPGEGEEDPRPAELGIATTGVAGPDPDPQTGEPAGTVWIGLSSEARTFARLFHFSGDRDEIREASVRAAVELLAAEVSALLDS
ncbi:CinA family protein [Leucobacter massiliensis]|uniref:Damage-inducible protein CinA n=1 Tax=Leucobacter massiliensis TaxID=1686285 RepID=A0A2S9QMB9_9MICO|nr:CinA family protein [Leucobacter massiliensis]PRI10742.1 damage-inducible protein CinA [Leucobacter massiliensis]